MAETDHARATPEGATGVLVLGDGSLIWGRGFGAEGEAVGEVCFNTAMTGYQEVMTDPSYAGQIVTFTFPHIGNVGTNIEDIEAINPHALGMIVREDVTEPSSFRSTQHLDGWLKSNDRIGLSGVDTRALTRAIRVNGAPNGVIAHSAKGVFDIDALISKAKAWPGLEGMDLARDVSATQSYLWADGLWTLGQGYAVDEAKADAPHVVAIDYGLKRNILRNLVAAGARVTVVPATATFDEVMAHQPDGVFLSNGPGDPAATGVYAVPVIRQLLEVGKPIFGICLGHQMLGLAVGAKTYKMHQGHRGANHPVKRSSDGCVEITSMNHGFAVEADSLPANAEVTHVSLFDGSLAGLRLTDKPAFSVQYHPEASPGPQDSHYLFEQFVSQLGEGCMILPAVDPDRLEQEWLQDQDVLANLRENGDRPELVRPVDVSFRGAPDVLEALTEKAEELGFEFLEIEGSEDGDPWVFLMREQGSDPESIRSLTTICLQIEAMFGVEYDGWGCVAETGAAH